MFCLLCTLIFMVCVDTAIDSFVLIKLQINNIIIHNSSLTSNPIFTKIKAVVSLVIMAQIDNGFFTEAAFAPWERHRWHHVSSLNLSLRTLWDTKIDRSLFAYRVVVINGIAKHMDTGSLIYLISWLHNRPVFTLKASASLRNRFHQEPWQNNYPFIHYLSAMAHSYLCFFIFQNDLIQVKFIKNGGHLGALGAFITKD